MSGTPLPPFAFEPAGPLPPRHGRLSRRAWSVRHAPALAAVYAGVEQLLRAVGPIVARLGRERVEPWLLPVERRIKGVLFDCRMCGQCLLSETGMACPMNCPKALRNGPCGGVRADGACEVYPVMACVWVEAWKGSRRLRRQEGLAVLNPPLDHRRKGRSSWLDVACGD